MVEAVRKLVLDDRVLEGWIPQILKSQSLYCYFFAIIIQAVYVRFLHFPSLRPFHLLLLLPAWIQAINSSKLSCFGNCSSHFECFFSKRQRRLLCVCYYRLEILRYFLFLRHQYLIYSKHCWSFILLFKSFDCNRF
jgi:hypothetical protein